MKRFLRGIAWALFALSIGSLTLSTTAFPPFERRMKAVPRLVLWAWERPEDLRFLDPQPVAVAFLAGTVELRHAEMGFRPRLQPLHVSRRMKLLAVVRVEVTANALLDQSQIGFAPLGLRSGGNSKIRIAFPGLFKQSFLTCVQT